MLSKEIESALNAQLAKEYYSSHIYLSMASWAEINGYPGISEWLYVQSNEERTHMLKFTKYINESGGNAIIGAIPQPASNFNNIKSLFDEVLKHEIFISNSINEIVFVCTKDKDFTTYNFLQWFVNEQIEEEKSARHILDKIKLAGESNLYLIDRDIVSMRNSIVKEGV